MSELSEIKASIENIEKILNDYCTARSLPMQIINVEGKISKRKFRKLKKDWMDAQK